MLFTCLIIPTLEPRDTWKKSPVFMHSLDKTSTFYVGLCILWTCCFLTHFVYAWCVDETILLIKVSITKHQSLVWFGMMHLISTNISLWIRALVREIMEEYLHDKQSTLDQPTQNYTAESNQTSSTFLMSEPGLFCYPHMAAFVQTRACASSRHISLVLIPIIIVWFYIETFLTITLFWSKIAPTSLN